MKNSNFKLSSVSLNLGTYTLSGENITEKNTHFVISTIPISKDFDLEPQASAEEIMAKIYEVVNGELTKVEAIGSGEIIAAREVRSV